MDRSLADLEANVGEYHLFEIDGNPVGCFSLTVFLRGQRRRAGRGVRQRRA